MKGVLRKGRTRFWATGAVLLLGALIFYQVSAYRTLSELRAMWRQETRLQQEIQRLHEDNARIEAEIKELSPEGPGVERIARQDLGWAEPGQIVVKIPEKR